MSVLQWALLILGMVAVIAIYVISRREKDRAAPPAPPPARPPPPAAGNQMDIFGGSGQFDEFGVGKPRKRTPPSLNPSAPPAATAPAATPPTPAARRPAPAAKPTAAAPPVPPAQSRLPVEERVFALLIAEREGAAILGPRIHEALAEAGLVYGARHIYHRMAQGSSQYSVAGIIKPGELKPEDAGQFSSPGLTIFMMLPGPKQPLAVFDDMLATARRLATRLNAEVFNTRRQPLDDAAAAQLRAEVERWAQAQGLA
ncbi:MAG: cell division protein ZipA C-terminal FtsZ-binding domain-containing protein [Gammaproteobacteria bacterium]